MSNSLQASILLYSSILPGVPHRYYFSDNISALDLATTPFALERAQQQELDITQDTPLTSFLENYRPLPTVETLGALWLALQTYEIRALKPFIRTASQSQSILIQTIRDDGKRDGLLLRRRVVPVEVPDYNIFQKISRRITGVWNRHRSLEALDLRDKDYHKLWETRLNRSDQSEDHEPWKTHFLSSLNRRRWWSRWRLLLICALLVVLVPSLLLTFAFLFAGALGWLHLDLTTLDRHLCGNVNSGPYPCTITANPDVAGIGVSLVCWVQSTLLLTIF